jgi:hypothetical protein
MQCEHLGILPSHLIFFFRHISQACKISYQSGLNGSRRNRSHPSYPPSFCVITIVAKSHVICEKLSIEGRRYGRAIGCICSEYLRRLVHEWHVESQVIWVSSNWVHGPSYRSVTVANKTAEARYR